MIWSANNLGHTSIHGFFNMAVSSVHDLVSVLHRVVDALVPVSLPGQQRVQDDPLSQVGRALSNGEGNTSRNWPFLRSPSRQPER